jgi:hypothetical protein
MSAFTKAANSPFLTEVVEQIDTSSVLVTGNVKRTALPKPQGTSAKVADSGRIRFGAGFRLPTSK